MRAPSAWNFFGFSRNSLISCSSSTASSTPATSRKVILGESADRRLARDLPNDITFEPPPWRLFINRNQRPKNSTNGNRYSSSDDHVLEPLGTMLNAICCVDGLCLLTPLTSLITFCSIDVPGS